MQLDFIDLYSELGIDPTADEQAIRSTLVLRRKEVDAQRLDQSRHTWTERMDWLMKQAEQILLDRLKRQQFDERRLQYYKDRIAAQLNPYAGADDLLWIDPEKPYVFGGDDDDPAYTVPALAYKLDGTPARAIDEIQNEGIEDMLRYVGFGKPNAARFEELATNIGRVRQQLGTAHQYPLLESVVVLCDPTIQRPQLLVNDMSLAALELPVTLIRPDVTTTSTFQLGNGGPRGCLFGYIWLEVTWAQLSGPPTQTLTIDGVQHQACYFELLTGATMTITYTMEATQLLQLERPRTHQLRVGIQMQPGIRHQVLEHMSLPVGISRIPSKAVFVPAHVTTPAVRRGETAQFTSSLKNDGEIEINARFSRASDPSVSVSRQSLSDNDTLGVSVDTTSMRFGGHYEYSVQFQAEGDKPTPTLMVSGDVLPTAVQHIFRKQPLADRLTLALGVALFAIILSPLVLDSLSTTLYWILWIAVATAAAVGATYWIARRIVDHIQASGDSTVTYDSIPLRPLLAGVGGGVALLGTVVALLPLDDRAKSFFYVCLLLLIAASFGFFANENILLFPHRSTSRLRGKSLLDRWSPDTPRSALLLVTLSVIALVSILVVLVASQLLPALIVVLIVITVAAFVS